MRLPGARATKYCTSKAARGFDPFLPKTMRQKCAYRNTLHTCLPPLSQRAHSRRCVLKTGTRRDMYVQLVVNRTAINRELCESNSQTITAPHRGYWGKKRTAPRGKTSSGKKTRGKTPWKKRRPVWSRFYACSSRCVTILRSE